MRKKKIYAITALRVSSKHVLCLDKRKDIVKQFCDDNGMSIIKNFVMVTKKNFLLDHEIYECINKSHLRHINIVVYSIYDLFPNFHNIQSFHNLIKKGKISIHFCKENWTYNSQTRASEITRLNMSILAHKYPNIRSILKDKSPHIADDTYIAQMLENIKPTILKKQ